MHATVYMQPKLKCLRGIEAKPMTTAVAEYSIHNKKCASRVTDTSLTLAFGKMFSGTEAEKENKTYT